MRKNTVVIREPRLFAAITSPRRSEIISSLSEAGPASAAELAERLGLTSHSLYYHIRFLERAGILKVESTRIATNRIEAIYMLAANRIMLDPNAKSQSSLVATRKALDSILRMASREVYHGLKTGASRSGTKREIVAIRLKARLTLDALRRVNRCLNDLEKIFRESNREQKAGKLYSLAIVLTPSRLTGTAV